MNPAIRRTWLAVVALFLAILMGTTYVQFIGAEKLNNNALNTRPLMANYDRPRGAILVGGKPIAQSIRTENGPYKYKRTYTDSKLYSGLTGFYSLANGATQLEATQETVLSGTSDDQFFDRLTNLFTGKEDRGADIELTIDPAIQKAAFDAIPDGQKGSVVVTDPRDGRILAMASKPTYDANDLSVQNSDQVSKNRAKLESVPGLSVNWNPAVYDRVSPGSSFKLLTLIAGLETGDFKIDGSYDNPPSWSPPGTKKELKNFSIGICSSQPNKASLSFIVAQSCNTPFAQGVQKIGTEKMKEVTDRFGFGEKPDWLGLAPTSASTWPENPDPAQLAYSSIGQFDVQTTALQMNMVAMGIANDGVIMRPQLIKQVTSPDLRVLKRFKAEEYGRGMSSEVAQDMTKLMREPVKSGTATRARVPGVDLAAKTGTADIGESGKVNGWITGFFPADDPQYAVTVVVKDISYEESAGLSSTIMSKIERAVMKR